VTPVIVLPLIILMGKRGGIKKTIITKILIFTGKGQSSSGTIEF